MTATVIPIHRNGTRDLPPDFVKACHDMWEAIERIDAADEAYVQQWAEAMYGIPPSVFAEVKAAKELREQAQQDLDDHPDPA